MTYFPGISVSVYNTIKLKLKVSHLSYFQIEQKSHDYPFGTAVNTEAMLNSSLRKYQDFVYKNFNWAVLENALKWSKTEEKQVMLLMNFLHAFKLHCG